MPSRLSGENSVSSPLQGPAEPETPAPVFALRAFKSALFGSPEERPAPQARISKAKMERPSTTERPRMSDPLPAPTPLRSPTKSILLTPGTLKAERKAVSFKDAPVRNAVPHRPTVGEEQRDDLGFSTQRGTVKPNQPAYQISAVEIVARSPLKEIQIQLPPPPKARSGKSEESGKSQISSFNAASSATNDFQGPRSVLEPQDANSTDKSAAKARPTKSKSVHISTQADDASSTLASYRSRSSRQLRKLLRRYEIVKAYAKMKDQEATELAIQVQKLQEENIKLAAELEMAKARDDTNPSGSFSSDARLPRHPVNKDASCPEPTRDSETRELTIPPESCRTCQPTQLSPTDSIPSTSTWTTTTTTSSSSTTPKAISTNYSRPRSPTSRPSITLNTSKPLPLRPSSPASPQTRQPQHEIAPETDPLSPRLPNLAPDRLAAAKVRLRIKAEQRRQVRDGDGI